MKGTGIFLLVLAFSVHAFSQAPVVSSINKVQGTVNEIVGISGSNFSTNPAFLAVTFGSVKGEIVSATNNFIEVKVPSGVSTSVISVTNLSTGLTGYSSAIFNLNYSGENSTAEQQLITDFSSPQKLFDLTIADFDGDGKNDVAATKSEDTSDDLAIFQNTSANNILAFTYLNKITNPELEVNTPTSNIGHGDLDGDGRPDLVASRADNTRNQIYVLRNISTPGEIKFDAPKSFFIGAGERAQRVIIRDLDGDGKPEVILTNTESTGDSNISTVEVFINKSTQGNISLDFNHLEFDVNGASTTNGLAVEDLDDDGKPEIITAPLLADDVFVLKNLSVSGTIAFDDSEQLSLEGNNNNLSIADMDRNGTNDLLVTQTIQNKLVLFKTLNDPFLGFETGIEIETGTRPWGLDVGDFNGDGKVDIFNTSFDSNEITYLRNTSTSNEFTFDKVVLTQSLNSIYSKTADLSGDGKPDIAITSFDDNQQKYNLTIVQITNCLNPDILNPAPLSICTGQTIRLEATSGLFVNYIWSKDDVEVKNGSDSFLDITEPGSYVVTAESEGGNCSRVSSALNVTIATGPNVPPPVTASNTGPVCTGQSVELTIEEVTDATYEWIGPGNFIATGRTAIVSNLTPELAGNYYGFVLLGECRGDATPTLVEVINPPDFTIQASGNTEFCEGNFVTLSVSNETGYTYQWLKDNTPITDATSNSYVATVAGDYIVQVSSTVSSCDIDTESVNVATFPPPTPVFSFSGVFCNDQTIQFTNETVPQIGQTASYSWEFGDGEVSTEENPVHVYALPNTYNAQLLVSYDGQNCADSLVQSVQIFGPTSFDITVDGLVPFCEGDSVDLFVEGAFTSYEWSTGETSSQITVKQQGTYSVSVVNNQGCISSAETAISTLVNPVITVETEKDTVLLGQSTQLEANGASEYYWDPTEFLDNPEISNPLATPLSTVTYIVTGTDSDGCAGTSEITITVEDTGDVLPVNAPKLFSPNGDTIDDFWVIENMQNFPDCKVVIFTRNGNTILEAKPYNNDWNGIAENGDEMPEGAYFFAITCDDGKKLSGSVSIIR